MEAADSSETSVHLYQTAKVQRIHAVLTWTVNLTETQSRTILSLIGTKWIQICLKVVSARWIWVNFGSDDSVGP
jgi:hypothetical protein